MAEGVVGIALGVLPLLISAPEQYSKAAAVFSRYRYFSIKFSDLATRLNTQRTIFNLANRSLLRLCVGQDEAVHMLADAHHTSWKDKEIERSFVDRLGDCHLKIIAAIELIQRELGNLEKDCDEYGKAAEEQQLDEGKSTRTGRSRFSKRLKFAFTEPQIQSAISRVEDLTRDYNTLITRMCSDQARQPDRDSGTTSAKKIAQFALVKEVAEDLYEALCFACTKHTEHQAHFCVQPGWNSQRAHLSFRIAFRKPSSSRGLIQEQLTWITVESSFADKRNNSYSTDAKALAELNHALRPSPVPPPCLTPRKRLKKTVKFQSPTPPPPLAAPVVECEAALQNLNADKNLCNQLQKPRASAKTGSCIGFLHHCTESKHLVYLDKTSISLPNGVHGSALVSLQELLTKLQQDRKRIGTLNPLERIHFARKLATTVLHLHETPWLKSSWRSDDVFLSDVSATRVRTLADIDELFLSVAVKQSPGPRSPVSTPPNRTLIRNSVLFGLGVIFLELAYEAPLQSLKRPEDVDEREERNTEYYIADRVRLAVSRLLGCRYAEIVRKCVQCDFGRGNDLNDVALQEVFHREVLEELEELEVKLRAVYIGG